MYSLATPSLAKPILIKSYNIPVALVIGKVNLQGTEPASCLDWFFDASLPILGFLRVEPMGLYFRAGCDWQDHATLYCGVLRAQLSSEHPVYVTKGTL